MITTRVFSETLKAYNNGYRFIANRGGTRSTKTFSGIQLIDRILLYSKKPLIATAVSFSFPHLEGGAIRDYEAIISERGQSPERLRHVKPHYYSIGRSTFEFIGFDNPGKALGASRDILFINEANKMPFAICHQLMQRTRLAIFLDWNPSEEFWWEIEEYNKRANAIEIHSTFLDNVNPITKKFNLTDGQLEELKEAKRKAYEEEKRGIRGYWWNWWQVYGKGIPGMLEGVIFQNWQKWDGNLPEEIEFYKVFAIDWGGNDPTTLTEINFDGDNLRMYVTEHIYQPQILNSELIKKIYELNPDNNPVICDSARKDKIYELQQAEINALGATKGEGSIIDGIERMQEFIIFVCGENVQREFRTYKWARDKKTDKTLNEPEDMNNHCIDGIRYGTRWYRKTIRPN
jgi:phage terminase large subunit